MFCFCLKENFRKMCSLFALLILQGLREIRYYRAFVKLRNHCLTAIRLAGKYHPSIEVYCSMTTN